MAIQKGKTLEFKDGKFKVFNTVVDEIQVESNTIYDDGILKVEKNINGKSITITK